MFSVADDVNVVVVVVVVDVVAVCRESRVQVAGNLG